MAAALHIPHIDRRLSLSLLFSLVFSGFHVFLFLFVFFNSFGSSGCLFVHFGMLVFF